MIPQLSPELLSAAKALGLLSSDGSLRTEWFSDPSQSLLTILSNKSQRTAFLDLLDGILPPEPVAGAPAGEKWHPLLGNQPRGNLYLTAKNGSSEFVTFGFAGKIGNAPGSSNPAATLSARLPMVRFGKDANFGQAIAGTSNGPLEFSLRLSINWTKGAQHAISLKAARVDVRLAVLPNPAASVKIVLEGLDMDGSGPKDTLLDPDSIGPEAVKLVVGLLAEKLLTPKTPGAEATAAKDHLLGLFGIGGGLPPLPLTALTEGPAAFQGWLNSLVAQPAKMAAWLAHLAGLFGVTVAASGSGTAADPWRVRIAQLNDGGLNLTAAKIDQRLHIGLEVALVATAINARVAAHGTVVAIPLSGNGSPLVLPSAGVLLRVTGTAGGALIPPGPQFGCTSLNAGLAWDGSTVRPVVELTDVKLDTATYPTVDLTSADSVIASASGAVQALILSALGNSGKGRNLAALAGLVAPATDAGAPLVDPALLVTDPAHAIGKVHRNALLAPVHHWGHLFAELAGLLGLNPAFTGNGTRQNPWRIPLGPAGGLKLELAAWNEQTSGVAADPQLLRIGLRAGANAGGWDFWWLCELLACDLPASGSATVRVMAGQHVAFLLQQVPTIPAQAGFSLAAASFGVTADWSPGASLAMHGVVTGFSVTSNGTTVNIPVIEFPPAAPFNVTNPAGVPLADFEALTRMLISRAALSWGGVHGFVAAAFLGLHRNLPQLPANWPELRDPGAPASMFTNPPAALRDWLGRLAIGVAPDGTPLLPVAMSWLGAVLKNELPASLQNPQFPLPRVTGFGLYEAPWAFSVTSSEVRPLELLAWLEPAGPPTSWAAPLAARFAASSSIQGLLEMAHMLAPFLPQVREALEGVPVASLGGALFQLYSFFSSTDGVVPVDSQMPTGGLWTKGTPFQCAHHLQLSHPQAMSQAVAQIGVWAGAGTRAVLLLGPAFSDKTAWTAFLNQAPGNKPAGASFNLRQPGVDPASVDLATVTVASDYYTADLFDNGSGDLASLTMQIGRVVDRIKVLRPGVKITLVAHSTAGIAARLYAAANGPSLNGLITIGTPHEGSPLTPILNESVANAIRLLRSMGVTLPAGSLKDALDHIIRALDEYLPPAAPGQLPVRAPYPVESFASPAGTDTGTVPALALGSSLDPDFLGKMRQAFVNLANTAAAVARPAPTHIAFGLRNQLFIPGPAADEPGVDARVRADAFRIALQPAAPQPARPPRSLSINIGLARPGGWLLGSAISYVDGAPDIDARIRRAELGLTIVPQGNTPVVTPVVRLHDAGWHAPTMHKLELGNPQVESLLGALFQAISPSTLSGISGIPVLFDALEAIGLVVPGQVGGFSLSAEGFAALQVDPAGFLLPRFGAALDLPGGLVGLTGPIGGPYVLPTPFGPFELYLSRTAGWRLGLRTKTPLAIAGGTLNFDASLALPSFAPSLDLSLQYSAITLAWSQSTGTLTLSAPPWVPSLTLIPAPAPAVFTSTLNAALPRLVLSAAASPILEAAMGSVIPVGPLDRLLGSPGASMQQSSAASKDGGFDGDNINVILQRIAKIAGLPDGPGITLPGGVQLTASGSGEVTFELSTVAPIGGVLDLSLTATIDASRHMTPGGTATLHVAPGGTWSNVDITFGASAAGVTLVVEPAGVGPIQLLPTFSGLGSLAAAGQTLLTEALDRLDTTLNGQSWYGSLRGLATALSLHNGTYSTQSNNWKSLLHGQWLTIANPATAANALVTFLQQLPGLPPNTFTAQGTGARWSKSLGAGGTLRFDIGFSNGQPLIKIEAVDLKFNEGPVKLSLGAGYSSPAGITCSAALALDLNKSAGLAVQPQFVFARAGNSYECKLLPLGAGTGNNFEIRFVGPAPKVTFTPAAVGLIANSWVLPLVSSVLVKAAPLTAKVWNGGLTVQQLLEGAKILPGPVPPLEQVVGNLLKTLGGGSGLNFTLSTNPPLKIGFISNGNNYGLRFSGKAEFPAGDMKIGVLFGGPPLIASESDAGISLMLFNITQQAQQTVLQFQPRLRVIGLGVEFSKDGGAPLVNLPILRIGSFAGSLFFELNLLNLQFTNNPVFGAGVELGGISLPLGEAISGNLGGNNPVAASMLESDGSAGKPQPPAPTLDVAIRYKNNTFDIQFHGEVAIWIPIQKAFGPIYIEQIGLEVLNNFKEMALLIDGAVKINGITVQADDLGVIIPFKSLSSPEQWKLDLRGLAVAYVGDGVTVMGGLRKNPGPPIQYDGMLSVDVAGRGFTAVGSYARPSDAQGAYTSLFIFVSLPIPLGGPPCFFVTGLGGGAGINRQLIVPEDVEKVPQFFLVQAIDDPSFGNDPMGALMQMSNAVPPKRGSFWFAAGVRFTSFVIVQSVAVIYVALDRGFEIGVLGVSRMALPTADLAIASVELALKARFSSAEGILSIQAQLTENSYILTRECRLTGGFAFFVWFPKGQFVLTLGGYHKNFKVPKEFPVVPRLGFRMRSGPVVVKGESYFALTNSCVMAGGRLEVAYDLDWVRAWFAAWADFLISWDPFYYDISIGVEIGVSAHIEICFIVCGTINFDLSIGAELHIFGPELHADVTIDLEVVSFTISFGADPDSEPDYIQSWNTFRDKYITTGDENNKGVSLKVTDGLLAPDPPGAEPAPGTKDQPWRLNVEFAFRTETLMPAMSWSTFAGSSGGKVAGAADLQIAPMKKLSITSNHDVTLFYGNTANVPPIPPNHFRMTALVKPFPEATWRHSEKQKAAANTIPAVSGLEIIGAALLKGKSSLIPISKMVDDLPSLSLPLPFATLNSAYVTVMQNYGTIAATLWSEIAPVTSAKMLYGAQQVLSGTGEFAVLRQNAGLPAGGISPMAQQSLRSRRSAPPLILPLTTGLNMLAPNLPPPPPIYKVPVTRPVGLKGYRLVAVLQGRLTPAADAYAALHTSVLTITAAKNSPRMAPPTLMLYSGAMLKRVAALRAPRPTKSAATFRTLINPQVGICSSVMHTQDFLKAAEMVRGEGVTVPAGTTHVWEIPPGKTFVTLSGGAAARVVFLSAGSRILSDVELLANGQALPVPAETSSVVVSCLGRLPREIKDVKPGFAAITLMAAPHRGFAGVGWELNDTREQVASSVVLGRGSTLVLARPYYTIHRGQKTHWSMVRVSAAAREQRGIETRLPISIGVVMIILDGRDSCAAERGDLAIGCDGATLKTPATPVGGGHRRAILYDVTDRDRERDYFTISVASEEGWRVAGIIGLQGRAEEWARRLHGNVPEDMVPNGPLTPYGAVRMQLTGETGSVKPVRPVTGGTTTISGRAKSAAPKAAKKSSKVKSK